MHISALSLLHGTNILGKFGDPWTSSWPGRGGLVQHLGSSSLQLGAVSTWQVGSESRVRRRARQAKQQDTWQLRGPGTELRCFVGELECPGPCRMGRVSGAGEGQRGLCGSEQEGCLGWRLGWAGRPDWPRESPECWEGLPFYFIVQVPIGAGAGAIPAWSWGVCIWL